MVCDSKIIKKKLQNHQNYLKNKIKVIQRAKIWRGKNRALVNECARKNPNLKAYRKKYYLEHKEKISQRSKINYSHNRKKVIMRATIWRIGHRVSVRKLRAEVMKKKRQNDINFRLKCNLQNSFHTIVDKNRRSISNLLFFSVKQLKEHLEKQFSPEMYWDNYGSYWHIDHKVPLSWFLTENQILSKAFKLSNLQPLPKYLNFSKSDSYCYDVQKNPLSSKVIYL